jgi:hypothetical protein
LRSNVDSQLPVAFEVTSASNVDNLKEIWVNNVKLFCYKGEASQESRMTPNASFLVSPYEEFVFLNNPNMSFDFSYTLNNYGHRCDDFEYQDADRHFLFAGCSFTHGEGLPYKKNWSGIVHEGLMSNYGETFGYYSLGYCGGSNDLIARNILNYVASFGKPEVVFALFPESSRKLEVVDDREMLIITQKDSSKRDMWEKKDAAFLKTYRTIYGLQEKLSGMSIRLIWSFWDESDRKMLKRFSKIDGYVDISDNRILDMASADDNSGYYDAARDFAHPGVCYNSGIAGIFLEEFYNAEANKKNYKKN